jgi:predicted DNA-binding helix-hairpin-helix protein
LLRVPGLGVRNVERILRARRHGRLRLADLVRLGLPMKKVLPFLEAADHTPAKLGLDDARLRERFLPPARQLELNFDPPAPTAEDDRSARSGEL